MAYVCFSSALRPSTLSTSITLMSCLPLKKKSLPATLVSYCAASSYPFQTHYTDELFTINKTHMN